MKRCIFLIVVLSWISINYSHAQVDTAFSLQESIDYALENSVDVKNARLDGYIAKGRVKEVRAIGLPQVNGTASVVDNPRLKAMILRDDNPLFANPGGGTPSGGSGQVDDGRIIIPNIFQLRSAGDANATVTQLIFSGSYFVGLQAAKTYAELSQKAAKRTKIETIEKVTKAYYLTQIGSERKELLNANISRLDTVLRQTKVLHENGMVEKIDVNRLEVAYNNLLVERQKTENLLEVGKMALKFQMGYPVNQPIFLEDKIDESKLTTINTNNLLNYENRIEYSLLQTQREGNRLQLKNIRAEYLPNIAAFATGGYFNMHYKFGGLFDTKWHSYSMIGLQANIPIFDGFSKYYRAQQAKLEIQKTENNIKNLENAINFDVAQAKTTLSNNLIALEAQKRNLELATEVAKVAKIKYQEGVGSNLEVVTAETDLREAQINYYNALFDTIVSNVDYQKALGILTE